MTLAQVSLNIDLDSKILWADFIIVAFKNAIENL